MHGRQHHTHSLTAVAAVAVVLASAAAAAGSSPGSATHRADGATSTRSRPAAPTSLVARSGRLGLSLIWNSAGKTGFQIEQATDPAMDQGVRRYSMRFKGNQFTPYGLTKGQTYYFRVRALDGRHHSAYSNQVSATPKTLAQPVEAMTYNIEELSRDGTHEGTGTVAPWSKRRLGAAALIRSASPDVIAIQEGADWVGKAGGARQVDSLRSAVGAPYVLAKTEIPPSQPHYFRTGVYIIYNSDTLRAVGKGGHFSVASTHYAAYQVFASKASGAKFLFIATHLEFGIGHSFDVDRETETKHLLKRGSARARSRHLPVFYAGDFNSAPSDVHFSFDGPGTPMRAAHNADAFFVAQTLTNGQYDSANQYIRKAKKTHDRIDHIYTPPGIGVPSAGIVIQLRHGRFVGPIPSDHNPLIAGVEIPY